MKIKSNVLQQAESCSLKLVNAYYSCKYVDDDLNNWWMIIIERFKLLHFDINLKTSKILTVDRKLVPSNKGSENPIKYLFLSKHFHNKLNVKKRRGSGRNSWENFSTINIFAPWLQCHVIFIIVKDRKEKKTKDKERMKNDSQFIWCPQSHILSETP